jgi:crossover junction endodeoxyribonuclease RuvC
LKKTTTFKTSIPTYQSRKVSRLSKNRIILGIDPGLASTGWGVLEEKNGKLNYIDHGVIKTKADQARADRLFFILQSIRQLIDKYKPETAGIENIYFGKNAKSAIPVAESRGVISACFAEKDIPLVELTPSAIKTGVVGQARAEKEQVQEMVKIILGLDEIPKPDHAADALAAAICAANQRANNK